MLVTWETLRSVSETANPTTAKSAKSVKSEKATKPAKRTPPPKPLKVRVQLALRSLHVYSSMGTLLLILFFALTGLLLNHPEWVPEGVEKTHTYTGELKSDWLVQDKTDWLQIVEKLRADHDLRGRASEMQNDGEEATLSFLAAGREATVTIEAETGRYEIEETSHGLVAMLGDLHRGHQTGEGWKRVIDLTAIFLIVVSVSGFGILLYLKKMRNKALLTLLGGTLLTIAAALWLS